MAPDNSLICPRCQLPLKETKTEHGIFWGCGNCGGRAVTVELLRRTFTAESINPLWLHAIRGEGPSISDCPLCRKPMIEVELSDDATVKVDVCRHCHFVWFDAHEVDSLIPLPPGLERAAREERERIAREKIKRFAEQVDRYQTTRTPTSEAWVTLADLFRMW